MTESDDIQIISEPESIQKQIAALNYSIGLLEDERDRLYQELYANEWKENQFAGDTQTKKLAEFLRTLGFLIVECKSEKQPKDDHYKLANQIWKIYKSKQDVKEFAKSLSKAKTTFQYRTDTWGVNEWNRLNSLCTTMQDIGWLKFNKLGVSLNRGSCH